MMGEPMRAVRMVREPTAATLLSAARRRVFTRLERAIEFPILVVCAPAGFGKSTVLREYFATSGQRYRALKLVPKHADLLDFMRAFATCLNDVAPELLTSFMGVYDRVDALEDAPRQIARWATAHLADANVSMAIDGLENVSDERLYAVLAELVDQTSFMPVKWIIVTQSATAFPMARWLADDRMDLPIDEVDLALTFEDFRAAVDRSAAAIPLEPLRALCASAANWPAAVALLLSDNAALSLDESVTAQRRPYSYFAMRAFLARPGFEQRFLLETCLFTSFDANLLTAAGWNDIDETLGNLRDAGAFVFVESGGIYRYHELFRAFLETHLRSSAGEIFARIGMSTADVCRRCGRWSDALELYTDLKAAGPLADVLSEHGFELMDRGESDIVLRALASLGDPEFTAFPVALALKASIESLHGSFDVAEAWFRHAIKNVGDTSARAEIVFRFATDLARRDRRDAIDLLQPIVEEGGHELGLAVSLAGLLATAYATHHMSTEAARTMEHALRRLSEVDDMAIRAKVYYQAGYVALFMRDFGRAKSLAQLALDTALASHLYDIAARALSILYNVAMDYEDDIAATRHYLEQLASCSIKAGSRHLLTYATLGQYEVEVLCGNLIESARLDEALKTLEVDYSVIATETLLPAQALRATWTGDFHRAYRLIAPTAEKQITPIRQAQRYAEIAVYAAAAGLRVEATAAASRALVTLPKSAPPDNAVIFTRAYVALALTLLGQRSRAMQMLIRLGRTKNLTARLEQLIEAIRMINERWARGRYSTELQVVLDRLDACDFGGIGRLLEALPLPETFRGQFSQISEADRATLAHLAAGLDAGGIAALSGDSADAVEASISSLCRKLGCTSARHAVALIKSFDGFGTIATDGH